MSAFTIEGKVRAKGEDILVRDMYFGEMKTQGGIIINNDDAKGHGVKPRWAKVYDIGPDQSNLDFKIGDWILLEHGRWSRKISISDGADEFQIQKADPEGIIGVFTGEGTPNVDYIGREYGDGESFTVNPEDFM